MRSALTGGPRIVLDVPHDRCVNPGDSLGGRGIALRLVHDSVRTISLRGPLKYGGRSDAYFGYPRTSHHNPQVVNTMNHQNPLASGLALRMTIDIGPPITADQDRPTSADPSIITQAIRSTQSSIGPYDIHSSV